MNFWINLLSSVVSTQTQTEVVHLHFVSIPSHIDLHFSLSSNILQTHICILVFAFPLLQMCMGPEKNNKHKYMAPKSCFLPTHV